MADDPLRYFRVEAKELAEQLQKGVLELEQGGGAQAMQRMLRAAHTLKGAARVVKQREIADLAHALEDALAPYRQAPNNLEPDVISSLLERVDAIDDRASRLAPAPAPSAASRAADPAPERPSAAQEPFRTVHADVDEMDALIESIAEAHVQLGSVRRSFTDIERARGLSELLCDQLAAHQRELRGGGSGLRVGYAVAEELRGVLARVDRTLALSIDHAERELAQVQGAARGLRLLPVSELFATCERAVRDAAQALGKQVRVETEGGNVRLEADALLLLQGALIQLSRNAVAHGIERPAERIAAGKPAHGTIRFEIKRRGDRVACTCRDDGRGVDLEAVRDAAARRGLLSPHDQPSASQLVEILLDGGITTARHVTEVSGRGVGLDVVREAIRQLSGEVSMGTEPGRGSWFELIVPMSLASFAALRVRAGDVVAAIPLDAVQRTMRIEARDIMDAPEGQRVVFAGESLPFMPLISALGWDDPNAYGASWASVVVEAGGQRVAIGTDRLLDTTHAMLKPLGRYAPARACVAGAALDREGMPELVLEPEGLVAAVLSGAARASSDVRRRPCVLVIDDSLTTRMLEQSILESAGYEVAVAASAEEGLEAALARRFDLCLVDVEMPGMNGFELVARMRADPKLSDTPAILVTSRNAPEDRARGLAVGARGYIVKSEFDQVALLALIRSLLR